jgi:hypothetical protein
MIDYDWEWGELEDYARGLEEQLTEARAEIHRISLVLSEHYRFIWKIKHEIRDFITRDGVQTRRPIKDDGLRVAPPRSSDTV